MYTEQGNDMVDFMFPPLDNFDPDFKIQEFSSFGFWRDSPIEIDVNQIQAFLTPLKFK